MEMFRTEMLNEAIEAINDLNDAKKELASARALYTYLYKNDSQSKVVRAFEEVIKEQELAYKHKITETINALASCKSQITETIDALTPKPFEEIEPVTMF